MGVLGQRGELMDGTEHADQLLAPLGEQIKLVEDLGLIKVKRACSGLTLPQAAHSQSGPAARDTIMPQSMVNNTMACNLAVCKQFHMQTLTIC